MKRNLRRQLGSVFIGALAMGIGSTGRAADHVDPAAACQKLATLSSFPLSPTQITLAKFNPAGGTSANGTSLPAHCEVQGIINKRTGADGLPYGDQFELRLPISTEWNGRFMFQGGGGNEGAVPPAVGVAGALSPTLAHGWAVASQDGGHENKDSPTPNTFLLEQRAVIDFAYGSVDATTQTAKFLIEAFYGRKPTKSYFVGCSTGGRQGMMLSQKFPSYYDGILAGDPVYDLESVALSELYGVESMAAITPAPIERLANGNPILYPAFPGTDQKLFMNALLAACDKLDGTADGVIDDLPACQTRFDPATFVFPDTGRPLQCIGTKNATCLSPAQIAAIKKINRGPRDSRGRALRAAAGGIVRDHVEATAFGYPYDGGFMAPTGIPSRQIGTPNSTPGDFALGLGLIPYYWMTPANPAYDLLSVDFDKKIATFRRQSPFVATSTSADISKFKDRGGKIIWYHGASDPGPPVLDTIAYFDALTAKNGEKETKKFARLYLVPGMAHCRGGPATDEFDLLTPLVNWVEHGKAPEEVVARGIHFASAPVERSRPLCPYPAQTRYTGPPGGDLSNARNYACVIPN